MGILRRVSSPCKQMSRAEKKKNNTRPRQSVLNVLVTEVQRKIIVKKKTPKERKVKVIRINRTCTRVAKMVAD